MERQKRAARNAVVAATAAAALSAGILLAESPSADDGAQAILAEMAGEFRLTSRFWPSPDGPPQVSTLSAKRTLVLGGAVLRVDVGSKSEGFRGTGLMGFDSTAGRFWYVWTDTSGDGRSVLDGTLDADGTGTLEGETPSPDGYVPLTVELRRSGRVEIHDYFGNGGDGTRLRWMELRYERRE